MDQERELEDPGAVMDDGLLAHVGSSSCVQWTYQSESSSQSLLSRGAGSQEEGVANQNLEYCEELLMRGRIEFSFEELRTERYNQQMSEKLRHLKELEEQLNRELEEKKKLLLLRRSQQQVVPEGPTSQVSDSGPAANPLQIYDESQSAAAARPAGNELQDEVFIRPDERGLSLKVQYPRPDQRGGATEDLQTGTGSRPYQSKTKNELSPVLETSVETNSLISLEGCSPPKEEQEEMEAAPSPAGGAVDPCDPDVRRRLLDLCDVTSSPDLHSEARPLPPVEEHNFLQLGGVVYFLWSRVVDGGSFSTYVGSRDDSYVRIKVDSCSVPWDFHQFQHLRKNSTSADSLPLISCFLFLDGCVTVYATPTCDHAFIDLTECYLPEALVVRRAVVLLHLVAELHSCRLLHAALQPSILTGSHRRLVSPDCFFLVDWSSSLDLNLQQDITSVQQVPSAQNYIRLGLLEPNDPPQLVDLVGLAETVHLLLTNSRMVAVRDDDGWMAEKFSGDDPSDTYSEEWRHFFRSLLNAGRRSSSSVLSELKEQLSKNDQ